MEKKEEFTQKVFEEGFYEVPKQFKLDPGWYGSGWYLTTYPQYAIHYINYKGVDDKVGFKVMQVDETAKVVAGFVLPGKSYKITNMDFYGKELEEGYDSHIVRVKFQLDKFFNTGKKDFFPVNDKNEELADEIVVSNKYQFLPCFEVTFKRTK